jgi:hypothetical protein
MFCLQRCSWKSVFMRSVTQRAQSLFCTLDRNTDVKIMKTMTLMHFDKFFYGVTTCSRTRPSHYRGFTITLRHSTLGRNLLDEWWDRRRGLYLTKHNAHKRQTSMNPVGFETAIPANVRPQTHSWDRAITGIGFAKFGVAYIFRKKVKYF